MHCPNIKGEKIRDGFTEKYTQVKRHGGGQASPPPRTGAGKGRGRESSLVWVLSTLKDSPPFQGKASPPQFSLGRLLLTAKQI
jgi:hypothetical protein